jgi:hypothetical protein
MEQTNNNYPRFEKGQVLTSQALNSYFGYLDEQQRLTRAKLLGVGIIDGLETKLSGNKLTITKGTAVTSDGYLIELKEDTTYNLIYEYDKKNMLAKQSPLSDAIDKDFETVLNNVKYVYYKDESDATKHNVNPKSNVPLPSDWKTTYVLALMVDFVSQDSITQCSELSCDIVQSNYQIEIRPVLMMYSCIGKDYFTNLIDPKIEVSLDKITAGIILNLRKPLEFFDNTYNQLIASIISTINGQIRNIITTFGKLLFNSFAASDIGNTTYLIAIMDNIVQQQYNSKNARFSGYYLDFLIQLRTAIREFLTTYHEFIWKYKRIPNNVKVYPRIVIIGFEDLCRQTRFLQDNSYMEDLTILRKHFYRIISMSNSFYSNSEDCIKSISTKEFSGCYIKKGSKLGEREIPGFYDAAQLKNWYAHSFADTAFSSYKNWPEKYEQVPMLSDYYLIFDNYYGRSLKDFYTAYGNSRTPGYTYQIHLIHVDYKSQPDFFSINEVGYPLDKNEYKKRMLSVYNRSSKLKNNKIFKDILDSILYCYPIHYNNDISQLISDIDYYLQNEGNMSSLNDDMDERDCLDRTKRFLSLYCNISNEMLMVGGCRPGGDLYVFYSGDKDESGYGDNNFIVLMVGTC